jgi:hypothetical protein
MGGESEGDCEGMLTTNKEINEAVAKKLGWTNIKPFDGYGIKFVGDRPRKEPVRIPEGYEGFDALPDYSTSIAAAWEIVEFCGPDDDRRLDLNRHLHKVLGMDLDYSDICDVTPMAICKAFLKLESENAC